MPDPSFPELITFNRFDSTIPNLIGVEKKSSFSSFIDSNQEPWHHSWRGEQYEYQPESNLLPSTLAFHAEPLAPLRQRDEQALDEIFEDTQIEAMIADICNRLKQLYPEPCWDDDPFDFLSGYL
ncbi:MAG: hypothetical protein AAF572_06515 [Cyanobacteria bacterium P01_B01_bin.77]